MSFWTAIVLIVLIVSITRAFRARHGADSHSAGLSEPAPPSRGDEEASQSEIAELKKRIEVLERIATDDRQRLELHDEIEALRERP